MCIQMKEEDIIQKG